jgi:8-oxo-dGTP pyrophosphatase MutT (NUDIX family)
MNWHPDVTVAAIIEHAGRFLLVEEHIDGLRVFNQPAGHVERGESILEAVVRETFEETAWRFSPEWLLGVYSWQHPRSNRAVLRFAFSGSVHGHDPSRPLDQPVIRTHWLTAEEIRAQGPRLRSPLVLRCLEDHLAGQHFALSAINAVTGTLMPDTSLQT